jgi:2-aminoadipate transaminase
MKDNDIDAHIRKIKECYGRQMQAMLDSIEKYFPEGVAHTTPEGGMFLWVTLPEGTSSRDLLDRALKDKVIFVPGDPFYVNRQNTNTLRLNFSCTDEKTIDTGIKNLGKAMKQLLKK